MYLGLGGKGGREREREREHERVHVQLLQHCLYIHTCVPLSPHSRDQELLCVYLKPSFSMDGLKRMLSQPGTPVLLKDVLWQKIGGTLYIHLSTCTCTCMSNAGLADMLQYLLATCISYMIAHFRSFMGWEIPVQNLNL